MFAGYFLIKDIIQLNGKSSCFINRDLRERAKGVRASKQDLISRIY